MGFAIRYSNLTASFKNAFTFGRAAELKNRQTEWHTDRQAHRQTKIFGFEYLKKDYYCLQKQQHGRL